MIQSRTRGRDVQVRLIVQHWKQLGRSLLLLAHYTSLFLSFACRSAGWFLRVIEWTALFSEHTLAFFEGVRRKLHRLCLGGATKNHANHNTKSG